MRVDPSELEDLLIDGAWDEANAYILNQDASVGIAGSIRIAGIDAHADPPLSKFYALGEMEPKFKAGWDRKRKDLADGSPSSYDMSLANFAVRDGWTDDEIVALIVAKRRRWGEKLKRHVSYYTNTIAKARQSHQSAEKKREEAQRESERRQREEEARNRLLDALDSGCEGAADEPSDLSPGTGAPPPPDRLAAVSELLNVKILRFVQYRGSNAQYRLETEDGAVTLGDASAFLSLARFRAAVFSATRRVIPRFKDKEWDRVAQALGDCLVIEEIGAEATEAGLARAWVDAYVSRHPPINSQDESADATIAGEAYLGSRAFWRDGRLHIWSTRLQQFLAGSHFDKVKWAEAAMSLRIFGADPVEINAYLDPDTKKKRVKWATWRLPEHWQLTDEGDD